MTRRRCPNWQDFTAATIVRIARAALGEPTPSTP